MNSIHVLQDIGKLTALYDAMDPENDLENLLLSVGVIDELRMGIESALQKMNSTDIDSRNNAEILEGLRQAYNASARAQERIQKEKGRIGSVISQVRIGNQARQAYYPPAIGMGYTEGNFVDSKK